MVRAICSTKIEKELNLIWLLRLNETIDQFAVAKNVHWYGHVLRRKDGHVLRRALEFEAEIQRKKGRPKRT